MEDKKVPAGKLLLVDDDEELVRTYEKIFVRHGYDVETASSFEEARRHIGGAEFDLVLTDLNLTRTGEEGFAVVKLVKETLPNAKTIVCTGNGTSDRRLKALALGASHFLVKPVSLFVLVRTVQELIR